ncbi:DUF559 domain-containing protein [Hamadaea tsunoensis]|uniref:DUF559 domain-containing protein n=1 Tax=Hamadaea tsunoensis TaxID=53368 RepID=UPI000411C76C|nr:DUF559 domain-containing protein [Hamadaea tsunoensis]
MHPALATALSRGPVRAASLPANMPGWALTNAVRAGHVVRVLPGVFAAAGTTPDLVRAAAAYVDGRGAVSHTTALGLFGWTLADGRVHVTVPPRVRLQGSDLIVVHSRKDFEVEAPWVVRRKGFVVTNIEDSLVAAWPLGTEPWRTGVVVEAVNSRRTTALRLATALAGAPHLPDRHALRRIIDLLAGGCRSPLEIFGAERVFHGLPGLRRQAPITIGGRTHYLDLYAEAERVNIEIDGASWHARSDQRERDLRRDAALATRGILVVRFSYRRLIDTPAAVRLETQRILDTRRDGPRSTAAVL